MQTNWEIGHADDRETEHEYDMGE